MTDDYLIILKEISDKVESLNTSLTGEVHALNLGMVKLSGEVKSINENLGERVTRLEAEYSFLSNECRIGKDDIHQNEKSLVEIHGVLDPIPEEVKKLRHKVGNAEQKIAIMEENNNIVQTEEIFDRLNVVEKSVIIINEHMDDIKKNTKSRNDTHAVIAFVQSPYMKAIALFAVGVIAAKYGIGVE